MKRRRRERTVTNRNQKNIEGSVRDVGPLYRATSHPEAFAEGLKRAEHLFVKSHDGSIECLIHEQPASLCVPRVADECIWRGILDRGQYTVSVVRIAPYNGLLTVTHEERVILQQAVGLMYNAEFGPDMEDVELWQNIGIKAADADYVRRGKTPPT